ncbi:MAG: DUF4131 domain-containing protein, partial [Betaproteobacteria bacterium]|nr:DUF4131 domain-containing protein [Betaproteobacteria bacterium]
MRLSLAGFVAGILLLQCSPRLFPFPVGLAAVALAALAGTRVLRHGGPAGGLRRVLLASMALLVGLVYADGRAQLRMAETLEPVLEGRDLALSGTVISLPESVPGGQRFLFRLDDSPAKVPRTLSLAWFAEGMDGHVPE